MEIHAVEWSSTSSGKAYTKGGKKDMHLTRLQSLLLQTSRKDKTQDVKSPGWTPTCAMKVLGDSSHFCFFICTDIDYFEKLLLILALSKSEGVNL